MYDAGWTVDGSSDSRLLIVIFPENGPMVK